MSGISEVATSGPIPVAWHSNGTRCHSRACRNQGVRDHFITEPPPFDTCDNCAMEVCPPGCANEENRATAYRPPPDHYSTGAGIDPWAVWDAFDLDRYTANAVKYLLRAGKKDIAPRLDDLKKARDYINKAIEREEKK